MSRWAVGLLLLGAALAAFGWWGTSTPEGRRRYEEMAGMIPLFASWAGWGLGGVGLLWLVLSLLRRDG